MHLVVSLIASPLSWKSASSWVRMSFRELEGTRQKQIEWSCNSLFFCSKTTWIKVTAALEYMRIFVDKEHLDVSSVLRCFHYLPGTVEETYPRDCNLKKERKRNKPWICLSHLSLLSRMQICFCSRSLISLVCCSSLFSSVRTRSCLRTAGFKLLLSATQSLMSWLYSCFSWRHPSAVSFTWTHFQHRNTWEQCWG